MTSLSSCARTLKSVGSSRVLIARRHWVARVRPVLHDAADKLGRQAMKRRPAALRATAPAPSLRLRREQQGELVDVSATVCLPPSRVGNPLQVSAIPPVRMSPKARRVIRNSSAGAQEEGIGAETGKPDSRFEWRFRRKPYFIVRGSIIDSIHVGACGEQDRNNLATAENRSNMEGRKAVLRA